MKVGIRLRLMLSLFALMLVTLWLTVFVLIKDSNQRMDAMQREQANYLAKTLAEGSLDALVTGDYELLERWVESAKPDETYAYAALVRPNGQVLTHTNLSLIGEVIKTTELSDNGYAQLDSYQQRPVLVVKHAAMLGKKHLANAHIAYYADIPYQQQEETVRHLVLIMLGSSLLLMVGIYLITDKSIKPIRELTNAVSTFTLEKGIRFSPRIFNRTDEVGALAHSFDELSYRLLKSYKELKAAHDEALLSKDQAEHANRAKSEFLANISHELRTPMHAVLGFSELGLAKLDSLEKVEKYFLQIKDSGGRLLALIDSLLEISKFEAGEYELELEQRDLLTILEQAVYERKVFIENKKLQLLITVEGKATASVDVEGIYNVLKSLLDNAIKYSTPETEINIKIIMEKNSSNKNGYEEVLHFRVQNQGVGIPVNELTEIFDDFTQSSETKDGSGGTGLGLAISKKIIEAHKGKMWAENIEEPAGVAIHFTLPVH